MVKNSPRIPLAQYQPQLLPIVLVALESVTLLSPSNIKELLIPGIQVGMVPVLMTPAPAAQDQVRRIAVDPLFHPAAAFLR